MKFANLVALAGGMACAGLASRLGGPKGAAFASGLWALAVALWLDRRAAGLRRALAIEARLARVDPLTGLGNDRAFREELARRTDSPGGSGFALALVDVDRLKAYNDAFGHPAGDGALRQVGLLLGEALGASPSAYRIGGDEFAALFAEPTWPDPAGFMEGFREAVAGAPWPLRPVTVSVGLARLLGDGPGGPVERADRRLYHAKHQGGDRVVAHLPSDEGPA